MPAGRHFGISPRNSKKETGCAKLISSSGH
jgi:hypothetical protein